MALVRRLRFDEHKGRVYPRWVDVDVPEGPLEIRERTRTRASVVDSTDLYGSLDEKQLEGLHRVEALVAAGELDAVRWTLEGTPEARALHCATYATMTMEKN